MGTLSRPKRRRNLQVLGRGSVGSNAREEDFIEHLFVCSTHNYLLFFTEKGRCYWKKVYELPEGNKQSKGRAIQNLGLEPDTLLAGEEPLNPGGADDTWLAEAEQRLIAQLAQPPAEIGA